LRRAQPAHWPTGSGARGRRGCGPQSAQHRRAVPPRAWRRRVADRLCGWPSAQERVAATGGRALSAVPQAGGGAVAGRKWVLDFVLLAAIWGSSFMFMRLGTVEFGALPTAALRVAVAAAFLLPLLWLRGLVPQLRQHWKPIFAIGVLNSGIPFVCFSFALLSITTGLSAILNATVPLFGALIAWLWLKDRPTG